MSQLHLICMECRVECAESDGQSSIPKFRPEEVKTAGCVTDDDAHLLVKGPLFQWRFILEQQAPASGGFLCAAGSRQLLPSTGVLQQTVPPSADATPHVTPPNAATPTNFSAASLWISFGFYKLEDFDGLYGRHWTAGVGRADVIHAWFTIDSWLMNFEMKLTG
jgi:hypothetical protein